MTMSPVVPKALWGSQRSMPRSRIRGRQQTLSLFTDSTAGPEVHGARRATPSYSGPKNGSPGRRISTMSAFILLAIRPA